MHAANKLSVTIHPHARRRVELARKRMAIDSGTMTTLKISRKTRTAASAMTGSAYGVSAVDCAIINV